MSVRSGAEGEVRSRGGSSGEEEGREGLREAEDVGEGKGGVGWSMRASKAAFLMLKGERGEKRGRRKDERSNEEEREDIETATFPVRAT